MSRVDNVPLYTLISRHNLSVKVQIQAIDYLMDAGVDLSRSTLGQWNYRDRMTVARELKNLGVDINAHFEPWNETLLHEAISHGNHNLCKLLLSFGADINARSPQGTPLQVAILGERLDTIELLLAQGADVNAPFSQYGTPLKLALRSVPCGYMSDLVEELLKKGADVNACSGDISPPLYIPARNGNCELLQRLLDLGSNVNTLNKWSESALHMASRWGHLDVVEELLTYGADVNI